MQTVTGTLAAALESPERTVVARVKADWKRTGTYTYDPGVIRDVFSDTFEAAGDIGDLTGWIESVGVDRSLSTDLPDAARVGSGFGAAQATVTLTGNLACGTPLTQAFSAHAGGAPLLARLKAPVYVELGAVGTAGAEYVRQFTGSVRSVSVDPDARTVTLTALDGREKLRTPVSLPVVTDVDAGTFMTSIAAADSVTTSFEASLNPMVSTPATDSSDPWETLQQIADAEQGVLLFDENDTLRFYNRNHMVGGAAVATITTDSDTFSNLKAVDSEETVDSVRNYVTVGAVPLALDPTGATLWTLAEIIGVPANSSISLPIEFPGPIFILETFVYMASKTVDGLGGDVTNILFDASGGTWRGSTLTISNPNNFDAFLVGNTTAGVDDQGTPRMSILGRCIRTTTESGYAAVSSDTGSQSTFGLQPLDVPANIWRQSSAVADDLAVHLRDTLAEPHATLSGVEIVGDPRLQLTDRVRVARSDGLSLDDDFWLVGITTRFSVSDGLAQSGTLREAT